jgi:hypothetical protein
LALKAIIPTATGVTAITTAINAAWILLVKDMIPPRNNYELGKKNDCDAKGNAADPK